MQAVDGGRSLLAVLAAVADPRGRQGRRYPIQSLLAVLILAAINGQSSLRGMWLWATASLPLRRSGRSFVGWA